MSKPMILGGADGADVLSRPVLELSKDELSGIFLEAAKPDSQWYLGLEIELLPFRTANLESVPHSTLSKVIDVLADRTGMQREYEPNGALTGLKGGGQLVSLEPGGQLEFASRPHRSLKALQSELLNYTGHLKEAGATEGLNFWAMGQQPFVDRDTSPKMPKPRYEMMRAYLGKRGARALDMMHLTGSVQCTVDFQNEENLVNKVRTAARVSPFLSALVAASPFTRGVSNGFKSVRYQIWLETDDDRCGIWPEMMDEEGLTIERYLDRIFSVPPMFFIRDGQYLAAEAKSFADYAKSGFNGEALTVKDLLDHLTTFFPEIRPKGYVELRGADCVDPKTAVAIAGFWRGILDEEDTRKAVDERLKAIDYEAVKRLQPEIARNALAADSPAGPVLDIVKWLVDAAYQRLSRSAPDCAECVLPLVERADLGKSPADELLETANETSVEAALKNFGL